MGIVLSVFYCTKRRKLVCFSPGLFPCKSLVSLHTCVKLSPKPKLFLSQSIEKTLVLGHANIFFIKTLTTPQHTVGMKYIWSHIQLITDPLKKCLFTVAIR